MGNSQTKISENNFPYKWGDFIYEKNIKNSFGDIKIVKHIKTNKKFSQKFLLDLSDEQIKIIINFFETVSKNENLNYMEIYAIEQNLANGCCLSPYLGITFDFFENTLSDFIKKNNIKNLKNENEYWIFIFDLMEVFKFQIEENLENNFINPKSIFYDEEKKKWKIIYSEFFRENNCENIFLEKDYFLSPESLPNSKNPKFSSKSKSNIFSLALIILKSIYLEKISLNDLYIKKNSN